MNQLIAAIGICVLAAGFAACTHKNSVLPTTTNPSITTNTPASGQWTVGLFMEHNTDETDDFSGYTFSFNGDGTFTANRSSRNITGTWSRVADDGLQKLVISISSMSDSHLAELNEDWVISLMTDNNINLTDDNGHHELKFRK